MPATSTETLGVRALRAYDREIRNERLRKEGRLLTENALRAIELVEMIKERLQVDVDSNDVFVPDGPQVWISATVDVDDITLATVGYGVGIRRLHVLFRCLVCKVRRPSLHEVMGLSSLGDSLTHPRSSERCTCRPGGEEWVTGGARP